METLESIASRLADSLQRPHLRGSARTTFDGFRVQVVADSTAGAQKGFFGVASDEAVGAQLHQSEGLMLLMGGGRTSSTLLRSA